MDSIWEVLRDRGTTEFYNQHKLYQRQNTLHVLLRVHWPISPLRFISFRTEWEKNKKGKLMRTERKIDQNQKSELIRFESICERGFVLVSGECSIDRIEQFYKTTKHDEAIRMTNNFQPKSVNCVIPSIAPST